MPHHTKAIIQALEPDIIIAQGNPPRNSMCKLFSPKRVECYSTVLSAEIRQGEIGDKKVLFLLTAHPATPHYHRFSWKNGNLPDELKKAFARARERYAGTDNDVAQDKAAICTVTRGSDKKNVMADRLFNTNEKYAQGAYKKMFDQGVIAIYGIPNGHEKLAKSVEGQRVFAYVNKKGILAVGRIADSQPVQGTSVFGKKNELHLKVKWETIVADDQGVTVKQVWDQHNYGLPVRQAICNMGCLSDVTDWIADELRRRAE